MASLPVIGSEPASRRRTGEILAATTQVRQRLVRRFAPPAPPPTYRRAANGCRSAEDEDIEFNWVRQTARRVGTVVHEALERFGAAG
jgi:hypothetical protein